MNATELVVYAARRSEAEGIPFQHSKVSKMIRAAFRSDTPEYARAVVDAFIDERAHERRWAGFQLYTNGVADPTGAHAAQNLDLANAAQTIRARRTAAARTFEAGALA